jgi:hypothetical protein
MHSHLCIFPTSRYNNLLISALTWEQNEKCRKRPKTGGLPGKTAENVAVTNTLLMVTPSWSSRQGCSRLPLSDRISVHQQVSLVDFVVPSSSAFSLAHRVVTLLPSFPLFDSRLHNSHSFQHLLRLTLPSASITLFSLFPSCTIPTSRLFGWQSQATNLAPNRPVKTPDIVRIPLKTPRRPSLN